MVRRDHLICSLRCVGLILIGLGIPRSVEFAGNLLAIPVWLSMPAFRSSGTFRDYLFSSEFVGALVTVSSSIVGVGFGIYLLRRDPNGLVRVGRPGVKA